MAREGLFPLCLSKSTLVATEGCVSSGNGLAKERMFYVMGLQAFYDKGPHPFLLAASRASHGRITISSIPNCLNDCGIFIVYTQNCCILLTVQIVTNSW